MEFTHDMSYAASADQVHALMVDRGFREEVCREQRATDYDVDVATDPVGTVVVIEQTQPAGDIPSFARKLVGDTIAIRQTETWRTPTSADLVVEVPGKPAALRGTITLSGSGEATTEHVEGQLTVSVPFIGAKIESMIGDMLHRALRVEERTAATRLAT